MNRQPPGHTLPISLILVLGGLLAPPAVATSPPVLIVPDGAASFDIEHTTLEAFLPPSGGPILQVTPTGRGSLTDRGTSHRYLPTAEFFDRGSDSFQFEYVTGTSTTWSTVFLVAGMRTGWEFELTLEDLDPLADAVLSDPQAITLNDDAPIDGAFDLRFELEPGESPFVRPRKPGVAPGGGKIGGGIDPGGGRGVPTGSLVLAAAIDESQPNLYLAELLLSADFGDMKISAAIASDLAKVSSPQISASQGQQWEVWWWTASAPSSRDGGAWLLVDGMIEATLAGIDNYGATASDWHFGALHNDGLAGFLQLDNLIGAEAVTLPRAAPLFADAFEGSHRPWKISHCATENGPPSQATAGTHQVALHSPGSCYLGTDLLQPERHLRARVEVDLGDVQLGTDDRLVLLSGWSSTGEDLFNLRLREYAGGLQVRADTDIDDGSRVPLPWTDLPTSGFVTLEVQWWAAPAGTADGGLRLWLDDVQVGELQGLANGAHHAAQVRLGASGIDPGASGIVVFDDFELWR